MPFFRRIIASVMMAVFVFGGYAGSFSAAVDDVIEDEAVEDVPSSSSNSSSSSKNKSSSSSSSSSSSDSTSFGQALFEILFEAVGYLWLAANVSVRFFDYPYMTKDVKYVTYKLLLDGSDGTENIWEKNGLPNPRFYRFSCDTSAFYMRTLGYGQECSFEGQALFIGPYFENTLYSNSLGNARDDYQGNVKLGGQFFLFSTNPLSCSLVVQWSHWYGNNIAEEIRSGISFGYDIRSYPFRPLAIQWRPTWSHFDKNVGVFESNLNAGILLGRVEVFGGWRYMSVYNYETDERSDKWNGATVGAKVYF